MGSDTAQDSHTPTSAEATTTRSQQRLLLWVGLGGLLILLITLGISAVSFLRNIESRHESIRADFLARMQVLVQLRNNVYRSGTRVHDFLLDEPAAAERDRLDILASRQRIEALEDEYARALRPEERDLFLSLRREVDIYFAAVIPVLDWTPADRQRKVDAFVRDELHPRRSVMLRIADEIESLNAQDMDRNAADTKSLFLSYRRLLVALVAVTFVIGCVLALFSMRRMVRLENESETRFRQVEHAKAELQALSSALVDAQESERRRLARELHVHIRASVVEPLRRVYPVQVRHAQIKEDHVGMLILDHPQDLGAIRSLGDDFEFVVALQQRSETTPDQRMIVADDDPQAAHAW